MIKSRGGVWWTDRNPHNRVPGTLIRADDQWQLSLIGTLPDDEQSADGLSLVPPTTIYGECLGTRYTLCNCFLNDAQDPARPWGPDDTDGEPAADQYSQRWRGHVLLRGDAHPADTLYRAASVELTGLSAWWPYGGLRGVNTLSMADYVGPEPTVADCGDGLILTIGADIGSTVGFRVRGINERVTIGVEREAGFTFTTLVDEVIMPMRGLIAICFGSPVKYFNVRLQPLSDAPSDEVRGRDPYPIDVDPEVIDATTESDAHADWPLFTAKDVDMSLLIPNWLRLVKDNPVPAAIAEPGRESGPLQSLVVEAVNAAETLHQTLYDKIADFPFATKVWQILQNTEGLKSRERRKVRDAVKFIEYSLESRLLQLARGFGEEPSAWLFNCQAGDWAHVAATVRNALSHGYSTHHQVERDMGALVGVLRTTQAVIQLRLLIEAGLPAESALVAMMANNGRYLGLMKQTVADWAQLSAKIKQ